MKTLITIVVGLIFAVCGIVVAEGVLSRAGNIREAVSEIQVISAVELLGNADATGEMGDEPGSTDDVNNIDISLYEDGDGDASIRSMAFNEGTTIRSALSMLSKLFRKNIIPSPEISGTVTVSDLYDVSFEEALAAVIGPNKYNVKDNFIRVYTLEEYQKNKGLFESKVITLYYITAAEAEKLITPLLSEFGSVASSTPAAQDTKPGKGGDTVSIRDTLVVHDMPDRVKDIVNKLAEIDKMPPQVLIEVTILEAVLDETTQFGIDLDALGASRTTSSGLTGNNGAIIDNIPATLFNSVKGLDVRIIKENLRIFIRALEEVTDTTVLANPKILALNKQAGRIHIGNNNGYLTTVNVSDGGTSTQEVEFLETGTMLEFRPFICNNGMIRMEINSEQSSGSVSTTTELPNSSLTTVQTNVMVKDGKTIVLGGLFKEETILGRQQVPILGDMPIIGGLFRNINDQSIRTELIILITPHIINDPQETQGAQRLEDVQRLAQKARKNIAWISRARRAEDQYSKALRYYDAGDEAMALCTLNSMWEHGRQYLEVDRLRERIITETQPNYQQRIERIMLGIMEEKESKKWLRRLN